MLIKINEYQVWNLVGLDLWLKMLGIHTHSQQPNEARWWSDTSFQEKKYNKKLAFTNYYGKPTRMIIIMAVNAEHDIQSN